MLPDDSYTAHSFLPKVIENEPRFLPESSLLKHRDVPLNICTDLFKFTLEFIEFKHLKLFVEHKVKILKKPLVGNEDYERLMLGHLFIMERYQFLKVVQEVYNFSLCCKAFYGMTERERKLIKRAATVSRSNQFYFTDIILPRPTKICPLIEPLTPQYFVSKFDITRNPLITPSPHSLISQIKRDGRSSSDFFKKISPIASEPKINLDSISARNLELPLIRIPSFPRNLSNITTCMSPLTLDTNALLLKFSAEEKDKDVGGSGGA